MEGTHKEVPTIYFSFSHMEKKRILVVDDEQDLCEIISVNLQTCGYDVDIAYSAEEVLTKDISSYNLLLLDVMMGEMSGFDLLSLLKKDASTRQIPVMFLTARDNEDSLLEGFRLGADDYISKPFSVKEMLARVKAVLSRSISPEQTNRQNVIHYKGIRMDEEQKSLSIDDVPTSLTRTEYELLHILLLHLGKVFSRQELIKSIWPCGVIVTDRTVDVNIARLRKKLGIYGNSICSRQGYGYYLSLS